MILEMNASFWKRRLGIALLACSLVVGACGDDDTTGNNGSPSTADDDSDDDVVGDDDSDTGDDDSDDDDDDDVVSTDGGTTSPPRTNIDGGGSNNNRMDASRTDSGGSSIDGGTATVDDGAVANDADVESSDATVTLDAAADARVLDAAADASRSDASTPVDRADPGKGDGRDVVTIGDSWMSNILFGTGGGIYPSLNRVGMQTYRNYALMGVMMLMTSTFGPAIPTQWTDAVREDRDIKTVIMTGGGNDIIQNPTLTRDCENGGRRCDMLLADIGEALQMLWGRMAAAGVQDIVHVLYSKNAGTPVRNIDANNQRVRELCAAVPAPTRCHIVETTDLVPASGLVSDGIHPTAATNDRLARRIYDLMVAERMRR